MSALARNIHTLVLVGPFGRGKTHFCSASSAASNTRTPVKSKFNGDPVVFQEGRPSAPIAAPWERCFQSFNLFPHLSALRNITLPLERCMARRPPRPKPWPVNSCAASASKTTPPGARLNFPAASRQRVALAAAISFRPRLVLLDEPTSALDPEMTAEVLDAIGRTAGGWPGFLFLSRTEMGFARQLAGHVRPPRRRAHHRMRPRPIRSSMRPAAPETRAFLSKVLKY